MRSTIVIGHIENSNGMATWCWEAAHALHAAGYDVALTIDEGLARGPAPFLVVELARPQATTRRLPLASFTHRFREILRPRPGSFFDRALPALHRLDMEPSVFLFNNGVFVDRNRSLPQFVVAWSYPAKLSGYLAKFPILSAGATAVGRVHLWLDLVRFWRSDWRSYREADGVLAVTRTLAEALLAKGIPAVTVHPGTRLAAVTPPAPAPVRRLLMAAENLDDPRKGVRWMIDALLRHPVDGSYDLRLVGRASDTLRRIADQLPCSVTLLGQIPREELQRLMMECDIFCFASRLDDWGYVLTEALANGMIPIAPDQSPFDEMVGEAGFLYQPLDMASFSSALQSALQLSPGACLGAKRAARQRAETHLSSEAFAKQLLAAIGRKTQGASLL